MKPLVKKTVQVFISCVPLLASLLWAPAAPVRQSNGCPENSAEVRRTRANGETVVSCQCIAGFTKYEGRCEPIAKVNALKNAKKIKDAVSQGQKPPFQPVWDFYQSNRGIAKGFAPEENRCAIVLSLTLGFEPRANEATLRDLKERKGVIPELADAEMAKRYYIRAQELANRIQDEWGAPDVIKSTAARTAISKKTGIVFIQDAWLGGSGSMTVDHIDVWDGDKIGAYDSLVPQFERAKEVWFWPLR
ncbi:MAG TPA: T6SS effector amidase Tae4 family protein [Pyrinomonadaceae bacterium]|nr:T6SS effector amidase Tae4 family protein [Pyrinomonadaceae bacterium]